MRKNIIILPVLLFVAIAAGCSSKSSSSKAGAETASGRTTKVYSLTEEASPAQESTTALKADLKPETKLGTYNSRIVVTFDGSGNRIETRYFDNHPRLLCLIARTGVGGQTEVVVFGRGGQNKTLGAEEVERVMSESPDQIAERLGIIQVVRPEQSEPPTPATTAPVQVKPPVTGENTLPPGTPVAPPKSEEPAPAETDKTAPTQSQVSEVKQPEGKPVQ